MTSSRNDSEQVTQEAASWIARLTSGEVGAGELEALRRWCDRDARRARELSRMLRVWESLGAAAERVRRTEAERAALPSPVPLGRRLFLSGALTASAAATAYLLVRPPLQLWPSLAELAADYRTGIGEQRQIAVPGGGTVVLNTRTALDVRAAAGSLDLLSGEAVIDAPGGRPLFAAIAGEVRCRGQAASFDVRCSKDRVTVTGVTGQVEVLYRGRVAVLEAHQQVACGPREMGAPVAVDSAEVTAWRRGLLVFQDEPLERLVEEVNRYRRGRIVLANSALAARRVTAQLRLDQLDDLVRQLCTALGAHVRRLPMGLVVLS